MPFAATAAAFALLTSSAATLPPGASKRPPKHKESRSGTIPRKKKTSKSKGKAPSKVRFDPSRRVPLAPELIPKGWEHGPPPPKLDDLAGLPRERLQFDLRDNARDTLGFSATTANFSTQPQSRWPLAVYAKGELSFRALRAWIDGKDLALTCEGNFAGQEMIVTVASFDGAWHEIGTVHLASPTSRVRALFATSEAVPGNTLFFRVVRPAGAKRGFSIGGCSLERVDG